MQDAFRQGSLYILFAALLVGTLWRGAYSYNPDFLASTWVFICLLLAAGTWEAAVTVRLKQLESLRSPALISLAAFSVFSLAGVAWSISPSDTFREALLVLGYVSAFFVVRGHLVRYGGKALASVAIWFVYSAGFVGIWGIVTYMLRIAPYTGELDDLYRAGSTFEYSNALSCFCLMALPVAFALLAGAKPLDRPLYAIAASVIAATTLLTFSRLGLVMLAVMSLFLIIYYWRRGLLLAVIAALATGTIAAVTTVVLAEAGQAYLGLPVVIALLAAVFPIQMAIDRISSPKAKVQVAAGVLAGGLTATAILVAASERVRSIVGIRYVEGFSFSRLFPHRLDTYEGAFNAFKTQWLAGSGLGTFPEVYEDYRIATPTKFAHNLVLQMAVDTGLAGAALFLVFLAYVLALSLWRLVTASGETGRALAIASLVFLVYNMFDWEWYIPALAAWFLVVVACLEFARRGAGFTTADQQPE